MSVIAIDFETANERRDSACAVGLAWIQNGRVVRRESHLIRPREMRFSPGNIRVHGILPADVRHRPDCAEVLAPYLADLSDRVVLAHNAGFDMGVLRASLAACGLSAPALSYLCTLQIARRVFPDPAGCGLAKVARRLGIVFEHHDAGEDAYACAEIALAAVRQTSASDIAGMARELGLALSRLPAGFVPSPGAGPSIGARAFASAGGRFAPPEPPRLRFVMRGSTGNRYDLVLDERPFGLTLRCSCIAGAHRHRCRHVDALVDGDVTDLVSANFGDVERLRDRILAAGGGIAPLRIRRVAAA